MSANTNVQLKAMTPEARVLFAVNEMKRRGLISQEEANFLRRQLLEKDPSLRLILSLAKSQFTFEDLSKYITAHLGDNSPENAPSEEFSPNTRQKINEVAEDTSPLGNMLVYKKHAHQKKDEDFEFKLNLETE